MYWLDTQEGDLIGKEILQQRTPLSSLTFPLKDDAFDDGPYEGRFFQVTETDRPDISETQRTDWRWGHLDENGVHRTTFSIEQIDGKYYSKWVTRDETDEEKHLRCQQKMDRLEQEMRDIDIKSIRSFTDDAIDQTTGKKYSVLYKEQRDAKYAEWQQAKQERDA